MKKKFFKNFLYKFKLHKYIPLVLSIFFLIYTIYLDNIIWEGTKSELYFKYYIVSFFIFFIFSLYFFK